MAYKTGTAAGYRAIWRTLTDFLLNDPDLVAAGQQWELKRGYFDPDIDYLTSLQSEPAGILVNDVATCMGWDDSFKLYTDGNERKNTWLARVSDAPNFLGFSSVTALSPTYYTVTAKNWLGESDQSANCPSMWEVQYSDDNISWNISDLVSGEHYWLFNETRTFQISETTPHKYWRLNITANNGGTTYVQIGRLRFYDSGNNWISRGYTTEYLFKTPGWVNAETDPTYSGMRLHIDPNNYYNIEWMGAIGYNDPYGWESQPSELQDRFTPLWEFDTPYWFVANGARLVVVMNVGERWIASYLGKFLPFGTKAQYAYPMIVGGSHYAPIVWSAVTHCWNIQGGYSATVVYRPNTGWVSFSNRNYLGSLSNGVTCLAPAHSGGMSAGNRQLPDSAYVLVPYIVEIDNNAYGELDGVRWISGDNQIPGNIIEDETGQEWLVFANHHLIGIHDFAALELK